jgi:hypothetical protein
MKFCFFAYFSILLLSKLHADRIPVLIVDGQNNHDWISTTDSLHATLQATNRFEVQIETAPQTKSIKGVRAPKSDAKDYIKNAYKDFRSIHQSTQNLTKDLMRLHGTIGIHLVANIKPLCSTITDGNGLRNQGSGC